MVSLSLLCFVIKQETAYEMRISYGSSDVCSSDLHLGGGPLADHHLDAAFAGRRQRLVEARQAVAERGVEKFQLQHLRRLAERPDQVDQVARLGAPGCDLPDREGPFMIGIVGAGERSEEHTSELQSLMRI